MRSGATATNTLDTAVKLIPTKVRDIYLSIQGVQSILTEFNAIIESLPKYTRSAITKINFIGKPIKHSDFSLIIELDFDAWIIDYHMTLLSLDTSDVKLIVDETSALKLQTLSDLRRLLSEAVGETI